MRHCRCIVGSWGAQRHWSCVVVLDNRPHSLILECQILYCYDHWVYAHSWDLYDPVCSHSWSPCSCCCSPQVFVWLHSWTSYSFVAISCCLLLSLLFVLDSICVGLHSLVSWMVVQLCSMNPHHRVGQYPKEHVRRHNVWGS